MMSRRLSTVLADNDDQHLPELQQTMVSSRLATVLEDNGEQQNYKKVLANNGEQHLPEF